MIKKLETEAEEQQLEFVSPNPINVDTMGRVPLDFRIELFKAMMRYNTAEIRARIAEARRKYQGVRMRYLTGII